MGKIASRTVRLEDVVGTTLAARAGVIQFRAMDLSVGRKESHAAHTLSRVPGGSARAACRRTRRRTALRGEEGHKDRTTEIMNWASIFVLLCLAMVLIGVLESRKH